MSGSVQLDAPAKLNLWLRILAREESGFHTLETLFCAVSLSDVVRVSSAASGVELRVAGPVDTGPPERNLCVRAAERFYRELDQAPRVRIELEKRIPSAAGLGGGSSDAAATLRALNRLHADPFRGEVLLQMGAELGSDVPFFLCGSPLALGWGRGERLLRLPPLPRRPVLIAHPGVAMPTAEAFRRLAERRAGGHRPYAVSHSLGSLLEWEPLAALAYNDFEASAAEAIPQLGAAGDHLRAAGAEIALLCGSGASLFGVFATVAARDAARPGLDRLGLRTWTAETLTATPVPRLIEGHGAD